jgi:septal ring factor EnvC (AmiA/AmiB activator)
MAKLAVVTTDSPAPDTLTPARRALARHRDEIARAEAELGRARAPLARIMASIEAAETVLRDAQGRLAESNRQAARAIAGDADAAPSVAGRSRLVADVAAAEQAVADAKAAAALVAPDLGAAESRLAAKTMRTDTFVIAVLVDESEAAHAKLREAQAAAIAAEAKTRGLREAIVERAHKIRASGADAAVVPRRRAAGHRIWRHAAAGNDERGYAAAHRDVGRVHG